ncbi:MAG: hypothetical protein AAGC70_19950 [Pseudomonadota bacterium]
MHLLSIRLTDVGPFSGDATVAGFSPGLNLLAAPNEAGKSTLFRALETVFRYQHTSRKQELLSLKPYTGGVPSIACEFVEADRTWHLEKQYLTSPRAELRTDDGQDVYRDRDVDGALAALLASGADRRAFFPVLWIAQTQSFTWPQLDRDAHAGLATLIQHQAEDASGGHEIARVEATVLKELKVHLTDSLRQPRKNGPLALAREALADAEAELAAAEHARDGAEERLAKLTELSEIWARLSDPAVHQARNHDIARHDQEIAKWADARAQLRAAEATFESRVKDQQLAQQRLTATKACLAARRQLDDLDAARIALTSQQGELERALTSAGATVARLQSARDAAVRVREVQQLQAMRADLEKRITSQAALLTRVETAVVVRDRAARASASNPVTDDVYAELLKLRHDRDQVAAQLASALPRIAVDYDPGVRARFQVDGQMLEADETLTVSDPVTIVVPGFGALTVSPGRHESTAELERRQRQLSTKLQEAYARYDISSEDELSERQSARRQLDQERQAAEAIVGELAPSGIEALQSERDHLRDRLAVVDQKLSAHLQDESDASQREERRDTTDAIESVAELDHALEAARAERDGLQSRKADVDQQVAHARGRIEDTRARHAELLIQLDRQAVEPKDVDAADAEYAEVAALANESARVRSAWRSKLPEAQAEQDWIVRRDALKVDRDSADREKQRVETERQVLEGQVRLDRQNGVNRRCAEATAVLRQRRDRCAELEAHTAALRLLADEIARARSESLSPVQTQTVRKLQEIAEPLFGRDTIDLADLSTEAVRIGASATEPWSSLSGGTREQIAVLARLAYARVLADQGQSVPVVLDDALVFADDRRLDRMFQILRACAEHHQIIVLSCQEQRFGDLVQSYGAMRLKIARPAVDSAIAI